MLGNSERTYDCCWPWSRFSNDAVCPRGIVIAFGLSSLSLSLTAPHRPSWTGVGNQCHHHRYWYRHVTYRRPTPPASMTSSPLLGRYCVSAKRRERLDPPGRLPNRHWLHRSQTCNTPGQSSVPLDPAMGNPVQSPGSLATCRAWFASREESLANEWPRCPALNLFPAKP